MQIKYSIGKMLLNNEYLKSNFVGEQTYRSIVISFRISSNETKPNLFNCFKDSVDLAST
jgi:hypothetical protein